MNYAKGLPQGSNGIEFQNSPPAYTAIVRYADDNASTSSVLTLSSVTTAIEVAAVGAAAVIRWIPVTETAAVTPFASVITAEGTANYDHVIPSGAVRRFVVPIERTPANAPVGSVLGPNVALGLYQRVAIKSTAVASVLTSEYN